MISAAWLVVIVTGFFSLGDLGSVGSGVESGFSISRFLQIVALKFVTRHSVDDKSVTAGTSYRPRLVGTIITTCVEASFA